MSSSSCRAPARRCPLCIAVAGLITLGAVAQSPACIIYPHPILQKTNSHKPHFDPQPPSLNAARAPHSVGRLCEDDWDLSWKKPRHSTSDTITPAPHDNGRHAADLPHGLDLADSRSCGELTRYRDHNDASWHRRQRDHNPAKDPKTDCGGTSGGGGSPDVIVAEPTSLGLLLLLAPALLRRTRRTHSFQFPPRPAAGPAATLHPVNERGGG